MDRKTAYTRTFLMLKDQPLHDESVKTAYFTWWQNVRENYESRSLRLTKLGFEWIESLDIKTYTIKFPNKIKFRGRIKGFAFQCLCSEILLHAKTVMTCT